MTQTTETGQQPHARMARLEIDILPPELTSLPRTSDELPDDAGEPLEKEPK